MRTYDLKYLMRCLLVIACVIGLCKVSGGAAFVVVMPFTIMAVVRKRTESLFFWLMFLMTSVCINSFFLPKGSAYGIGQRGMLVLLGVSGVVSLAGQKKNRAISALMIIFAYILYMIVPSISGWVPIVSFLKLILFSLIFTALLSTSNSLLVHRRLNIEKIRSVLLAFAIFFVLGSYLVMPFPSMSQLSGEAYADMIMSGREVVSLFCGMTIQPQALGPIVAGFGCILLADLLFAIKKTDKLYLVLILSIPYLIYTTSSRTAMGAYIIGNMFVVWRFMCARNIAMRWRTKVMSVTILVVIGLFGAVLAVPSLQNKVAKYALKYSNDASMADVSMEKAFSTRQGLMDIAMADFKRKPLIGNGFQVDERLASRMSDMSGLILSAPIEKGVWITAILQEGGVIGFSLYLFFLLSVWVALWKLDYNMGLTLFVYLHLSNLGEFTMFSMSGMGGLLWLFVFIGILFDECRNRSVAVMPTQQVIDWR